MCESKSQRAEGRGGNQKIKEIKAIVGRKQQQAINVRKKYQNPKPMMSGLPVFGCEHRLFQPRTNPNVQAAR
jgi:hypothetical protein